jgi:hypothetical protein
MEKYLSPTALGKVTCMIAIGLEFIAQITYLETFCNKSVKASFLLTSVDQPFI